MHDPATTAPPLSPHIVARGVELQYPNGLMALQGVDFTIGRGEFLSVVGPSGCGKSTLLRALAGLDAVTGGSLSIAGAAPIAARRRGQDLAVVFQRPTLLPWRTVRQNIALPLELGVVAQPIKQEQIEAELELVGLKDFAENFPSQLSGGMQMRVALARALVTRPGLLLMDEPFGALDDLTRTRLNEELLIHHAREGWSALFVTHNVSEAVYLSDRVLVMSPQPGRIVADVAIPFPKPRRAALRAHPEFARLTGEIAAHLTESAA